MATVDEEEHAVLDRLTFDYHQKLQGKPQSHELVGASRPGARLVLSLLGVLRAPCARAERRRRVPTAVGRLRGDGPAPLCRRCTRC